MILPGPRPTTGAAAGCQPQSGALAPDPNADLWCELCPNPAGPDDFNPVAGMRICTLCLEASL